MLSHPAILILFVVSAFIILAIILMYIKDHHKKKDADIIQRMQQPKSMITPSVKQIHMEGLNENDYDIKSKQDVDYINITYVVNPSSELNNIESHQ